MKNRLLNNCMEHKLKKKDFYCPGAYGIAPGAPKLELRQNQLLYSTWERQRFIGIADRL